MHEKDINFSVLLYHLRNNSKIGISSLQLPVKYPPFLVVLIDWIGTLIRGISSHLLPVCICSVSSSSLPWSLVDDDMSERESSPSSAPPSNDSTWMVTGDVDGVGILVGRAWEGFLKSNKDITGGYLNIRGLH